MTAPRIVLDELLTDGQLAVIAGEPFRFLVRIRRIRPSEQFFCMDGRGTEFAAEVLDIGHDSLRAYVFRTAAEEPAPRDVTACFGILKGDKNELLLKVGTQLGLSAFQPLLTERTVVRLDAVRRAERLERFRRIVGDTARTSFLSYVPDVMPVVSVDEYEPPADGTKLLFSEKKGLPLLSDSEDIVVRRGPLTILFGPEGGIGESEHRSLEDRGFIPLSLGGRALRAEFAFAAAAAVVLYLRRRSF